ncbi:MAG: GSU3473 family protein [Syntrophorhabdus sp.]
MLIRVQYINDSYGDVDGSTLDKLLLGKTLKQFYRLSEERWVDVYRDSIRGLGGNYSGPDRRQAT